MEPPEGSDRRADGESGLARVAILRGCAAPCFAACVLLSVGEVALHGFLAQRIASVVTAVCVALCAALGAQRPVRPIVLAFMVVAGCAFFVGSPFQAALFLVFGGLLANEAMLECSMRARIRRLVAASAIGTVLVVCLRTPSAQRVLLHSRPCSRSCRQGIAAQRSARSGSPCISSPGRPCHAGTAGSLRAVRGPRSCWSQ